MFVLRKGGKSASGKTLFPLSLFVSMASDLRAVWLGVESEEGNCLHYHKINCFELQFITNEIYMTTKLTVTPWKWEMAV